MAKDMRALLEKPAEFKPPVPLPDGTYYGQITAKKFDVTKSENETPFVRFTVKLTHADESVEGHESLDVAGKIRTKDYYLSEAAGYRLYQIADALDIAHPPAVLRSITDIVEDFIGKDVMVKIKQRPGMTPDDPPRDEIDSLGAVPA